MTYQEPIVEKREYVLLKRLISLSNFHFDARHSEEIKKLSELLKSAKVLDEEQMPQDIVRLQTTVTVSQFESSDMRFQIVLPDAVTIKEQHKSVLSSIGVACFGQVLGSEIQIISEGILKQYSIVKVNQPNTTKSSVSLDHDND